MAPSEGRQRAQILRVRHHCGDDVPLSMDFSDVFFLPASRNPTKEGSDPNALANTNVSLGVKGGGQKSTPPLLRKSVSNLSRGSSGSNARAGGAPPVIKRSGTGQLSLNTVSAVSDASKNTKQTVSSNQPRLLRSCSHGSGMSRPSDAPPSAPEPRQTRLRRSTSTQSLMSQLSKASKVSIPLWARPVLVRSSSVVSSFSATSTPAGVSFTELREQNSIKVIYDAPFCKAYEFMQKVGEGGFGQVWKASNRASGEVYAIKRIAAKETKDLERLLRELKAFERFDSPYIVTLYEVILEEEAMYMVMNLCTGGDLLKYLENYKDEPSRMMNKIEFPDHILGLPSGLVGFLMWQMLAGISYMHHHRFCHRDVKLQNYVLKDSRPNPILQLVDFGMAVRFRKGEPICGTMGTMKFMAPEVLTGKYSEKCDIWSIGVVNYILCTERSPWGHRKTTQEMQKCITDNIREPWPMCDKPRVLKSLINSMMCRDVEKRPCAKELLKESTWLIRHAAMPNGKPSCCVIA